MSITDIPVIAGGPILSALIIIFTAIIMLYIARRPAHEIILSISRLIHRSMRLSSRSVIHMALKLTARNREVLLAAGEEYARQNDAF